MWPVLQVIFVKIVLPIILAELKNSGYAEAAQAIALKYGTSFVEALSNLKTYREYPKRKERG